MNKERKYIDFSVLPEDLIRDLRSQHDYAYTVVKTHMTPEDLEEEWRRQVDLLFPFKPSA